MIRRFRWIPPALWATALVALALSGPRANGLAPGGDDVSLATSMAQELIAAWS